MFPRADFEAEVYARHVGHALAKAPVGIPYHRVVNATGGTAAAWTQQRALLEAEGVTFRPNGCADLGRFGWRKAIIDSSHAF